MYRSELGQAATETNPFAVSTLGPLPSTVAEMV
jgi:hypothetical protein